MGTMSRGRLPRCADCGHVRYAHYNQKHHCEVSLPTSQQIESALRGEYNHLCPCLQYVEADKRAGDMASY